MNSIRKFHRHFRSLQYFLAFHMGKATLSYLPHTVVIEPASRCNLRCVMCPHSFNHGWKDGIMELKLFERIIAEIRQYAFRVILQNRGEPLLNRQLPDMVKKCKDAGLHASLNTNATLLKPELSERLISSGLDLIVFSFNGETREVHNAVSQAECFDRMFANVLAFLEKKNQMQSRKPVARVQVLKFCREEGEKGRLELGEAFRRRFEGLPVDVMSTMWAVNRAGNAKQTANTEIRPPRFNYMPCRWLWSEAVIGWDGKVLPCCNDFNEDYVIGDVSKDPLSAIWNNGRMVSLRKALVQRRNAEVALCRACDILYSVEQENTAAKRVAARLLRVFTKT